MGPTDQNYFTNIDQWRVWQGIPHISQLQDQQPPDTDKMPRCRRSLFFCLLRSESSRERHDASASNSHSLTVQEQDVRRVLGGLDLRKAAGPDSVTGRVLKERADQLSEV